MYESMYASYRVVCSYNPKEPEKFYIDIMRDGFCSHDVLFEMQKKRYHDDKLEQVGNIGRGIMLRESRDGHVHLFYTQHRDFYARQAQENLRKQIDPLILRTFRQMKEQGAFYTICESLIECNNRELQDVCNKRGYAENLQEENAIKQAQRIDRLKKLKEIRRDFYAKQKYASAPHLALMLKQAERSGD